MLTSMRISLIVEQCSYTALAMGQNHYPQPFNMLCVAQLVRAPVCGTGGREFKSHHTPHRFIKGIWLCNNEFLKYGFI